jgi:hypothetical protein
MKHHSFAATSNEDTWILSPYLEMWPKTNTRHVLPSYFADDSHDD